MLVNTGERQISPTIEHIAPDHANRYKFVAKRMKAMGLENVLDAACGVGYGSWVMAEEGLTVTGIDICREALDFALENYNHPNIDYVQADITEIKEWDYDSQRFDIAVSLETIEHVRDDRGLLESLYTAAPYLIASVPNESVVPFDSDTHPFHIRHYTVFEFTELLENVGYQVLEMWTQYDKHPGEMYRGDDGRTLIAIAKGI